MKERLISHHTTAQEKDKPFKGKICLNSYGEKYKLNIHQRTHHKNEKPSKCDICNEKLFQCNVCQNCYNKS